MLVEKAIPGTALHNSHTAEFEIKLLLRNAKTEAFL